MTNEDNGTGGMDDIADDVVDQVDKELADEEARLLRQTTVDLEQLRPQISDPDAFDKLVEAVRKSTQKNEDLAQLKARLEKLGEGVMRIAKEVAGRIKLLHK
jgi:hypothetical protein